MTTERKVERLIGGLVVGVLVVSSVLVWPGWTYTLRLATALFGMGVFGNAVLGYAYFGKDAWQAATMALYGVFLMAFGLVDPSSEAGAMIQLVLILGILIVLALHIRHTRKLAGNGTVR